ncbi:uncharacterized protein LOC117421341 [Acipenser ruthenus]|uniref:uncharacterized protein LOC117421341 n=1 Tax=Acipenser ruthenus TaxID=7906 RepID=UPI002740E438|nr:uncharacterized protein LOC117421341 [Acipenser ruthenus]XP_058891285.1 uncharacterized protein LOC117421341 [Acipenser ruthenus]XP_058891289.1 uncharacterized protein LOC117421341 [Acipenser ruthenus]
MNSMMKPFQELKTYGKRMRKVDPWFSPDTSSSSSDLSICAEENCNINPGRKRWRKQSTAAARPKRNAKKRALKFLNNNWEEDSIFSVGKENRGDAAARKDTVSRQSKAGTSSARLPRNAKQRALTRIKLTSTNESDDVEVDDRLEDFFASSGKESTVDARDQRATVSRQSKAGTSSARLPRNAKQSALSRMKLSSTDESNDVEVDDCLDDSIAIHGKESTVDARDQRATVGRSAASSFVRPIPLETFVTDHKNSPNENEGVIKTRPVKCQSVCLSRNTLNSSEDFQKNPVPSSQFIAKRTHARYKHQSLLGKTSSEMSSLFSNSKKKKPLLSAASFNSTTGSVLKARSYKRPRLPSETSAICQTCYKLSKPSLCEISFSNNETEEVCKTNMEEDRDVLSLEGSELKVLVGSGSELKNCSKCASVQNEMPSFEIMQHNIENREVSETYEDSVVSHPNRTNKEMLTPKTPERSLSDQSSSVNDSVVFVSAQTPLQSLVAQVNKVWNVSRPVVLLKRVDVPKHLVKHNLQSNLEKPECHELQTENSESRSGQTVSSEAGDVKVQEERHCLDVTPQYVKNTVSLGGMDIFVAAQQNITPKRNPFVLSITVDNSPPTFVSSEKNKQLMERCIVSQPDVVLQRAKLPIDIYKLGDLNHRQSVDFKQELAYCSLQIEKTVLTEQCNLPDTIRNHSSKNSLHNKDTAVHTSPVADSIVPEFAQTKEIGSRSRFNVDLTLCRRLSAQHPFGLLSGFKKKKIDAPEAAKTESTSSDSSESRNNHADSLSKKTVSGRVRTQGIPKEKPGTGQEACISGFSTNRWTKNGNTQKEKLSKHFANHLLVAGNADNSLADFSCRSFHTPERSMGNMGSLYDANDQMPPVTPLRKECFQMSSFLQNISPQTLNTHNWSRLKASLSVHKKMKVILTPDKSNLSNPAVSKKDLGNVTPRSNKSQKLLSGAEGPVLNPLDISDAEKLFQECQQDGPLSFEECIPLHKMQSCIKIGEGAFGEVFCMTNNNNEFVALKIIPIEGEPTRNGEMQKKFGEILHEVIVSKELSNLSKMEKNRTDGFITLHDLHCAKGLYPEPLLKAWDKFDKRRNSENDRPDFFEQDQLFLILAFEFGGIDLENMQSKLSSLAVAKSILHQVTASLAVAEQALCFEHRDLHWGNILVKKTNLKEGKYTINGTTHNVVTNGVHVNIIDYTISRLEIEGLTVSCDISTDEQLFMGQGDYQFEIYRKMREENNNSWSEYNPHTNVLWLHYLTDKLLHMSYKNKPRSLALKAIKTNIEQFYRELLQYKSATEVLKSCSLFQ